MQKDIMCSAALVTLTCLRDHLVYWLIIILANYSLHYGSRVCRSVLSVDIVSHRYRHGVACGWPRVMPVLCCADRKRRSKRSPVSKREECR